MAVFVTFPLVSRFDESDWKYMPNPLNSTPRASGESDLRWAAIVARDPHGSFFFSVKTTGVYCRPACPARLPKREHVHFYATASEAQRAGFRPCKRCKPDQPPLWEQNAARIAAACRLIEEAPELPALGDLASRVGLSAYYFHRLFKSITGLTPKAYATANRTNRLRRHLSRDITVTQAIYDAGYNSNGRFYGDANSLLGMTPSNFRAGGIRTNIRFAIGNCSLGAILVAQSERGICAILLGDSANQLKQNLREQFPHAELISGDKGFADLVDKVIAFVEHPASGLELPLDIRGTAFQQRVWQALRKIPFGKKLSYSELARNIGSPQSTRAVAQACAANTLAVAIPCHRVVRSDGALSGYRWGIDRKQELLKREASE